MSTLLPMNDQLNGLLNVSGHQVKAVRDFQSAAVRKHLHQIVQLRLELVAGFQAAAVRGAAVAVLRVSRRPLLLEDRLRAFTRLWSSSRSAASGLLDHAAQVKVKLAS